MTILRTVIFIDGQNFKYNLQAFRFKGTHSKEYSLNEKHFDWRDFFKDIVMKFSKRTGVEHRLLRAYWYNAETITPFRPTKKLIEDVLEKYKVRLPIITEDIIKDEAEKWWKNEKENFDKAKSDVFDEIQKKTDFLEFKYVGLFGVKPFTINNDNFKLNSDGSYFYQGTRAGEKGVDIGIATDMIAKMPYYDAAILVSGDADFQPVVRYLKDHLKYVYQFSIAKGVPPDINYLSPFLKSMVDVFEYFDEEELLGKYLYLTGGSISIPLEIRPIIEKRIKELREKKRTT